MSECKGVTRDGRGHRLRGTLNLMERRFNNRRSRPEGSRPQSDKPDAPMLLGEPSPSLARINMMNMVKLEAKIVQLANEQTALVSRLERLNALDEAPTEKLQRAGKQLDRLKDLEKAARTRLEEKVRRKAEWERKNRS